ncbi:MAG: hypothetical protein HRU17_13890 [Polyangiaceae bacterium]|nr:hypothetical protein [Polyangiaceae bacterium]
MSVSTDAHSQPSGGTQPSATQPAASPPAAAPRSWAAATPAPARPRIGSKKLPPPTAEQLKGLELMQAELKAYEAGANDYRGTLTMIVRHHYEERRRRVLAALDAEIGIERKRLDEARDEAIRRLEVFVAIYSGDNAHPLATPDAMYRLAALYEERTRADYDAELSDGLKKPISLYREIIELYPNYEEISGVYYYLGHAYTDSGRFDEGQHAWKSLVCSNRYQVKADPKDPEKISVPPMEQDHDFKFWDNWYNQNPVPMDEIIPLEQRATTASYAERSEERRYRSPYADPCERLPQKLALGEEPRYVAEVWWQIGNYHFDQMDQKGGPYNLNRAMSAYERSMAFKKPPLYGVAMYKRSWTYFKQQRYRTAVQWFVNLLHYADEQEELTGDPGADFRQEAYTYIAGSLTYVDFDGPPAEDPYIPRNDVLDVESDPVVAEDKMRIALERVQDPALVPQDKPWTVEIYKALAQEFIEITHHRNAIATLEITLERFPLDRDAPKMRNKISELYDQLARLAPEGSDVKQEYSAKALVARTKLAEYVGSTAWTEANKDDPEALREAEELVREGLQRAAADHTNYARGYYTQAQQVSDEEGLRILIEKSISEYRLAETGWAGYLQQDTNALDAYETRFWLADARYWIVVLQLAVGRTPTPKEVTAANEAAIDVRESHEDDKYLQPSAYYLVTMADQLVQRQHQVFDETDGASGFQKREELVFAGEGDARRVVKAEIPRIIVDAIAARRDYNARISYEADPQKNGLMYTFQNADYFFIYGHFDEAKAIYEPLMTEHCGKDEWGYKAWEKLISMSNFSNDAKRSRELAEGKSCAFDEETQAAEDAIRKPVKQGVAYLDAREMYNAAEGMPDGPARDKKWREAAAAYRVALDAAPERDEAPEAAMNGAYAYKQVGDYDQAIAMYTLFIDRYGNSKNLNALRDGDPSATPPMEAEPKKFEARVRFLKMAFDALASAYVLFFNYPKAADTFGTISKNENFTSEDRISAARQAVGLYASLGDSRSTQKARDRFFALGASAEERAEVDFTIASATLKQWDEHSPNSGANATARGRADRVMRDYHDSNKNKDAAAKFVVEAAFWVAKLKHGGKKPQEDTWWKKTIAAYDRYAAVAPKAENGNSVAVGSKQASMAAEGDYRLLDKKISKAFDYDNGHHRFKGTPVEVINDYRNVAGEAADWNKELQHIIDKYSSPEWATASVARQGTLYDSLRSGLYNTRPPQLVMFDKKTERLLEKAENSDNEALQEQADAIRMRVEGAWRDARDQEINSADEIMVVRYSTAVTLARRYNVSNPAVVRAIQRLAFFTDIIGEAKLKQYTSNVLDLNYTDGLFLRIRPGLVTAPEPSGMPAPLPAAE